jgi:glucose-6-phosphate isomerase
MPQSHANFALPQELPAWAHLTQLALTGTPHLRDILAQGASPTPHALAAAGITLDASRQRITPAVLNALLALAHESQLGAQRDAMFAGDAINTSENRAVLHVALRSAAPGPAPWGQSIHAQVHSERERMLTFAQQVREGALRGFDGNVFTDVLNIGIGGSDLGPRMAQDALAHLQTGPLRVHYLSNPDAWAVHEVLHRLDPARTLVIVASKTFTTQETLTNAASVMRWLLDAGCPQARLSAHLVAVTASAAKAQSLGYMAERTFLFWDWVGGRYSLWSSLGLPLAIAIGTTAFEEMLAGANAMDAHFCDAPLEANLPVRMALHGIWNRNFLAAPSTALVSYAARLARFAPFVQQMDMESNGKRTHCDGRPALIATGPIVWGGLGIDGQHAYFQLLHQGQHLVPMDFIGVQSEDTALPLAAEHHRVVNLNLRAQAQALALGRDEADTRALLAREGLADEALDTYTTQRSFAGNVPSHIVWLDALTPIRLGALVALYEHKVFCQAAIWRINAFDQWGVELGKTMAKQMEAVD